MKNLLRIRHARQIVNVCTRSEEFLRGKEMSNVAVIESDKGLSLVVGNDGCIKDFGEDAEMEARYKDCVFQKELDATGKTIMPGMEIHMA